MIRRALTRLWRRREPEREIVYPEVGRYGPDDPGVAPYQGPAWGRQLRQPKDASARICRRYFTGSTILCKTHGRDLSRCDDWEEGRFARDHDQPDFDPRPDDVLAGRS